MRKFMFFLVVAFLVLVTLSCTSVLNQKPTIEKISGPEGTIESGLLTFEWLGHDIDGSISSYEYDIGAGWLQTNETQLEFTVESTGTYTIKARAVDNKGLKSSIIQWVVTYKSYNDINYNDVLAFQQKLSSDPIDNSEGNLIPVNSVLLYETSENRLGKLIVVNNDNSNHGWIISNKTFNSDGSIYSEATEYIIPGTCTYCLDACSRYVDIEEKDFQMDNISGPHREFLPWNNAKFHIYK